MRRIFTSGWFWVGALLALVGCNVALGGKSPFQAQSEKITDQYSQKFQNAVPYPQAQMTDSLERRNLRERLLRFNKPSKIGYVYLLGFTGDFIGYYAIKGKVSSVQSQMTSSMQTWDSGRNSSDTVIESMGDDGSFGPNEGGDQGVFFFTTNNVMVETTMNWIYSDSPLPVAAKPINPKQGQTNVSNRTGG